MEPRRDPSVPVFALVAMNLAVCTVTLRSREPQEVVALVKDAGFAAAEWTGSSHVPTGDLDRARAVKALCEKAGLVSTSYASYYICDDAGPEAEGPFRFNRGSQPALDTALALGVADIRVWAGRRPSAAASDDYRKEVAARLGAFCDQAKDLGLRVHLEYHRNTLTDDIHSALRLMDAVGRENLFSYWQPRHGVGVEENRAEIRALGERLSNVHVFHWLKEPGETFAIDRRPLSEGRDRWLQYFAEIKKIPGERYAMMEFVRGDELKQFFEDAAILREINAASDR